jgi:quinol monooxygenase YgiN
MCCQAATQQPLVRIAELEIEPTKLDAYKAAVTEEIETSMRVEPGVLAIYSVAVKGNPSQLRLFEIYGDDRAYRSHIEGRPSSRRRRGGKSTGGCRDISPRNASCPRAFCDVR